MTNRSRMGTRQPRGGKTFRGPDVTDADRRAIEALQVTNILWRQIDRWVNEGGALGDGTGPSAPKGT